MSRKLCEGGEKGPEMREFFSADTFCRLMFGMLVEGNGVLDVLDAPEIPFLEEKGEDLIWRREMGTSIWLVRTL